MPNRGRPPHARARNRQAPVDDRWRWSWDDAEPAEPDPPRLGPPVRTCPRCSTQAATDAMVCPYCLTSYWREPRRGMSRRAKVVRRLVPTLLLLFGGAIGAAALALDAGGPAKASTAAAVPATPVAARTAKRPAPQHVEIHSTTQSETSQSETAVVSVAQALAVAPTVQEQSWLAPVIVAPSDDSGPSSDGAQVTDTRLPDSSGASDVSAPGDTGSGPSLDAPTVDENPDDADGDGCSDSYDGACVKPYEGSDDVNCSDVEETDFDSLADDPYGLDRDADGIACESV
jgi:hypothetical protein